MSDVVQWLAGCVAPELRFSAQACRLAAALGREAYMEVGAAVETLRGGNLLVFVPCGRERESQGGEQQQPGGARVTREDICYWPVARV